MKLTVKIAIAAILLFLAIGTALGIIMLHGCVDIELFLTDPDHRTWHSAMPLAAFLVLALAMGIMLVWSWYFSRFIVLPLRKAEIYTKELASSNIPQPLSSAGVLDEEIVTLYSALNFLRDRQQNLNARLKWGIEKEEKQRLEIEYYDELQLTAFNKLLPEMRRTLGVLKALTLLELASVRSRNDNESAEKTILPALKRIGKLSRQMDHLADISRLERKRWSSPQESEFSAMDLVHELTDSCRLSLESRQIRLVGKYLSGTPELVFCDRELLYQLLQLLVRSVSRSLLPGSCVTFTCKGSSKNAVFEISDRSCDGHRELLAESYNTIFSGDPGQKKDLKSCSTSIIALEIVRSIAAGTGCVFEIDSNEESPTILRITVPAVDGIYDEYTGTIRISRIRETYDTGAAKPADLPELHVFLANDDAEESDALTRLLINDRIRITSFPDQNALLTALKETPQADAVIYALSVNAANVKEIISNLRFCANDRSLPVIVVTPALDNETEQQLSNISRAWNLTAPLNFAQMVSILRRGSV